MTSIDHLARPSAQHPDGVELISDTHENEGASLVHARRSELGDRAISELAVTGKELRSESTVGDARRLLGRHSVKVVPILRGSRYVGAVDLAALADAPGDDPVGPLARDCVPSVGGRTPAVEALSALDEDGGTRLVVLDEDAGTYLGIVCLRRNREWLCVDEARVARGVGALPP